MMRAALRKLALSFRKIITRVLAVHSPTNLVDENFKVDIDSFYEACNKEVNDRRVNMFKKNNFGRETNWQINVSD